MRAGLDERAVARRRSAAHGLLELHGLPRCCGTSTRRPGSAVSSGSPVTVEIERDRADERGAMPAARRRVARESPRPARSATRSRRRSGGPGSPSPRTRRSSSSSAAASPETTTAERPFTRGDRVGRPTGDQQLARAVGAHASDTMPAGPTARTSSRLRSATTRAASSQRQRAGHVGRGDLALRVADHRVGHHADRPPQRGQRHHHREQHRLHHVDPVQPGAPGAPRSTSSSDQSTYAASASSHAAICSANTGEASSSSSAHAGHCEPWPGNTNTVLPAGCAVPAAPRRRPARRRPAPPARAATASPVGADARPRGARSADRVVASDQPTSSDAGAGIGRQTRASSRAACVGQRRRPSWADSTHGTDRRRRRLGARGAASGAGRLLEDDVRVGAADAERRHARPARPVRAPATAAPRSAADTAPADQSTCGDGSSTCSVAGSTPCRIAMHHLDHARHARPRPACGRCST